MTWHMARRWIDAKGQLPKDGVRVLVACRCGFVGLAALYRKDGKPICKDDRAVWINAETGERLSSWASVYDAEADAYTVTHWMRLPDPPDDLQEEITRERGEDWRGEDWD